MDDDEFYAYFRKQHPMPHFLFPDITPVAGLEFERLVPENAIELYRLFQNDGSPFVDERFKELREVESYVKDLAEYSAYSPKHGGQDWLVKTKGKGCVAVLHLYDLNKETVCDNHKRVWIGFATKQEARRKGLTSQAVRHFIKTVLDFYPNIDYLHAMAERDNLACHTFLKKLGFLPDLAERMSKEDRFFVLTRAGLS